jgi:hypothetical protein
MGCGWEGAFSIETQSFKRSHPTPAKIANYVDCWLLIVGYWLLYGRAWRVYTLILMIGNSKQQTTNN